MVVKNIDGYSVTYLIKYAHNTYDRRTRKDTVGRYIV